MWTIDDAPVPDGGWPTTGQSLWDQLATAIAVTPVRFVCPIPEPSRTEFALAQGLRPHHMLWHLNVKQTRPSTGHTPNVDAATAGVVPAPRIYDPGGGVLCITEITDPARALPSAHAEAVRLGCPVVVVEQPHADTTLAEAFNRAGYNHHCDFFDGEVTAGASAR